MIGIFFRYIKYFFISGHRRGHGIHSPYVFSFVRNVLLNDSGIEDPAEIMEWHKKQKNNKKRIKVETPGEKSHSHNSAQRKISEMVRNTAISIKNGKLLYRLVKIYKPDEIIEFGTGLGISTAYLASAAPDTKIISIEASDEKIEFAGSELKKLGFSNIQLIRAEFDDLLPELRTEGKKSMIFIDGNHNYHATGKYFRHFRDQLNEEGIIIFDDINWSKGMGKAWNEICGDERTGISINLFFFGIVFFKKMEGKLHYNIKF